MQTQSDCLHITRKDDLHIFTFRQPTRRAIDEWVRYLDVIHDQTPPTATGRYLLDYRLNGLPPIAYAAQTARNWMLAHPGTNFSYVAFLHQSIVMMTMVDNVVRLLPGKERIGLRFFTDEAEALDWLSHTEDR